jgi:POT family proton-dependent oligopeptide transporter
VLALGVLAVLLDLAGPPLGNELIAADGTATRDRMLSIKMDAAQLSSLNPLFVMFVIPFLNFAVYAPLRSRGIEIKPLQKMTAGMFLAAGAFAAAAIVQQAIQAAGDGVVHALWQVVPYFIMTVAEVLVSITGLEFAYTQAPRAMKSTIMSFWLLCVTFGNLLVAFLAPLQKAIALSSFFWLFAGLMAGAATIFLLLALFYKGKTYLQESAGH